MSARAIQRVVVELMVATKPNNPLVYHNFIAHAKDGRHLLCLELANQIFTGKDGRLCVRDYDPEIDGAHGKIKLKALQATVDNY